MAWMSDEAWDMVSDSMEKKSIARSARSTRTHCGKRGSVKFPSDYLTKKEIKAMSGAVETYRMNEPMSWDEFTKMPIDLQKTYISHLREKFNAPDQYIAEMFGKTHSVFLDHLFRLKMSADKWMEGNPWNKEEFMAWRLGVEHPASEPEPIDILDKPMNFDKFVTLTDEQKKEYIERLRQKFDVHNKAVAKMLGVSDAYVGTISRKLDIGYGRPPRCHRSWDEDGWNKWLAGDEVIEAQNDIPELTESEKEKINNYVQDLQELSAEVVANTNTPHIDTARPVLIVPMSGTMTFEGNADDILTTLATILSGTRNKITVTWESIV